MLAILVTVHTYGNMPAWERGQRIRTCVMAGGAPAPPGGRVPQV